MDDLARVGLDQTEDILHQRGFAGAALADQPQNFTAAEREAHVVQHGMVVPPPMLIGVAVPACKAFDF